MPPLIVGYASPQRGCIFAPGGPGWVALGRVVDLELWWVVFDDLFTSRKQ